MTFYFFDYTYVFFQDVFEFSLCCNFHSVLSSYPTHFQIHVIFMMDHVTLYYRDEPLDVMSGLEEIESSEESTTQ